MFSIDAFTLAALFQANVKLSASASGQAIVAVDFALQTRRIAAA
jgi:hypothetical protein